MIRASFLTLALAGYAGAASAQAPADPHAGHVMPAQPAPPAAQGKAAQPDPHAGHVMPAPPRVATPSQRATPQASSAPPPADPHAGHVMPAPATQSASQPGTPADADPHAGHTMPGQSAPAADPHAGHAMPAAEDPHAGHAMAAGGQATGADQPVGNEPPPPIIRDSVADRVYGAAPMQRARTILANEHGSEGVSKIQADLLEWAPANNSYRWELEGWYGGDLNRFVVKTEGEGDEDEGVETAEVQLLYSRAVARYTDLQVGLRYDIEPGSRAYAAVGIDTMFPYWFEAEGTLFLSEDGDILGRLEGSYDLRLTQRLILQPRAELEFAAQDVPEIGVGSGVSSGELGLRLRYEFRREFAPYIGVNYERRYGGTADFARAAGEDVSSTRFVVGLRAWF